MMEEEHKGFPLNFLLADFILRIICTSTWNICLCLIFHSLLLAFTWKSYFISRALFSLSFKKKKKILLLSFTQLKRRRKRRKNKHFHVKTWQEQIFSLFLCENSILNKCPINRTTHTNVCNFYFAFRWKFSVAVWKKISLKP